VSDKADTLFSFPQKFNFIPLFPPFVTLLYEILPQFDFPLYALVRVWYDKNKIIL